MQHEMLQNFRVNLWDNPEVRSSVPLEGTWSYPIPVIKDGKVLLRYLIFTTEVAPEKSKVKYYPPFKYVETSFSENPKVTVSRIRKPEEHTQSLGETPPSGIRGMSYEQVEQLDDEFNSIIEKMLPFVGKQQLYEQDAEVVKQYRRYFDLLVEPEMQKEYQKISPEFFEWLDGVRN